MKYKQLQFLPLVCMGCSLPVSGQISLSADNVNPRTLAVYPEDTGGASVGQISYWAEGPNGVQLPNGEPGPYYLDFEWHGLDLDGVGGANDSIYFTLKAEATSWFAESIIRANDAGWGVLNNSVLENEQVITFTMEGVHLSDHTAGIIVFEGFTGGGIINLNVQEGFTAKASINGREVNWTGDEAQYTVKGINAISPIEQLQYKGIQSGSYFGDFLALAVRDFDLEFTYAQYAEYGVAGSVEPVLVNSGELSLRFDEHAREAVHRRFQKSPDLANWSTVTPMSLDVAESGEGMQSVSATVSFSQVDRFFRVNHEVTRFPPLEGTCVPFNDVAEALGIITEATFKYGGPTIADFNNDGRYDFITNDHNIIPAYLFWGNEDNTFTQHPTPIQRWDLHGIAAGDYDRDGDVDVIATIGGGNGTNPQPPVLHRNDGGQFTEVTASAGLALGARGRSVKWIDLDSDGYLDLVSVNAGGDWVGDGPQNYLFRNNQDGTFSYQSSPVFENIDTERALVTDFNSDHVLDLILWAPWGHPYFLRGNNDFTFTNVTSTWFPGFSNFNIAMAEADIDNDGDMDIYMARGKTDYMVANNTVEYDPVARRMDLRDEGNASQDGISFIGDDELILSNFFHSYRGFEAEMPLFLGAAATRNDTPFEPTLVSKDDAMGFPAQLPQESGWYLGYLGNGQWRLEWLLLVNLGWDIRAAVTGIDEVIPDWQPQDTNVPDVLLRNDGDRFTNISASLPPETTTNNRGVTTGDFNNDGFIDFFVYRWGGLEKRIPDVLLLNDGEGGFLPCTNHGATALPSEAHGDMGAALDFDFDGFVDIFSGDDDLGQWHLFRNLSGDVNPEAAGQAYVLIHVGYSPTGIDPMAAEVTLQTDQGIQFKRVGSNGSTHSQSQLNILHFGIGSSASVNSVSVRWRSGESQSVSNLPARSFHKFGD